MPPPHPGSCAAWEDLRWPLTVRSLGAADGSAIRFLMNLSQEEGTLANPFGLVADLLTGRHVEAGETLALPGWGVLVLREET